MTSPDNININKSLQQCSLTKALQSKLFKELHLYFRCGESGHLARDCLDDEPREDKRSCYNCGEVGHLSRDCPDERRSERRSQSKECYK